MRLSISVDSSNIRKMAQKFPNATEVALSNFIERAGRTLERGAKQQAPVITGNLRRSIFFQKNSSTDAFVTTHANYAKYVHGKPFYSNSTRRRETPFFTYALLDGTSAIKQHQRVIMKDIVRNIGKL